MPSIDVAMESTSQQILEAVSGGGGAVKVVQRGVTGLYDVNSTLYYTDITISAVDISKTFINVDIHPINRTNLYVIPQTYIIGELFNATTLRIHATNQGKYLDEQMAVYWEVIEMR